jgi:hypothetical protein
VDLAQDLLLTLVGTIEEEEEEDAEARVVQQPHLLLRDLFRDFQVRTSTMDRLAVPAPDRHLRFRTLLKDRNLSETRSLRLRLLPLVEAIASGDLRLQETLEDHRIEIGSERESARETEKVGNGL